MTDKDREIATKIWPQHMLRAARVQDPIVPYDEKIQAALAYLGDRYLCARDQNASRQKTPSV